MSMLQPPSPKWSDPASSDTRHSLVAWWGETMAILNEIGSTAHRVAKELRPGGSLEGLMHADDLDLFGSRLEEQAAALGSIPPRPAPELIDPLEDAAPTFEDVKRVAIAWLQAEHPDYNNTDVELALMNPVGISREVFSIREADKEDEDAADVVNAD